MRPRVTRRGFLRLAAMGGSGLLAAYAVGCDGEERPATPTPASPTAEPTGLASPTAVATPETPTATGTPAPLWRPLSPTGVLPPPRRDHSLVTGGERVYLFGGRGAGPLGDLWAYDVGDGTWTELPAAGGPSARFGHNAAFDASAGVMIVFGGQGAEGFFDDTWHYIVTEGEWVQVATAGGPSARYGAASAFDPAGGLLMSHGFTDAGRFDDTWSLSGEEWTDVSPGGERPVERCLMRGAWDAQAGRFLMFGGQTTGTPFLGDLWEYREGTGWSELTGEPKPSPRNFYAMALDEGAGRLLLFGGNTEDGPVNDLWSFDASANLWSELPPEAERPSPRFGQDAVWLASSGSLMTFGGRDDSGDLNDLWELSLPG